METINDSKNAMKKKDDYYKTEINLNEREREQFCVLSVSTYQKL